MKQIGARAYKLSQQVLGATALAVLAVIVLSAMGRLEDGVLTAVQILAGVGGLIVAGAHGTNVTERITGKGLFKPTNDPGGEDAQDPTTAH